MVGATAAGAEATWVMAAWLTVSYAALAFGARPDSAETPSTSSAPAASVNLVRNGGFETGDACPDGWLIRFARKDLSHLTDIRVLDRLTIFWDSKASTTGKCIRMDTDVNQKEVHRRMEELIADPDAPPWSKTPTKPPKYDTAAGLEGVTFYSDPIPVEKGKIYRMAVDVKGRMRGMFFPKMFVRGYGMARTAKGQRVKKKLYDTYVSCRVTAPDHWHHFEQTFCPTDHTPAVTEIRVMLMAYWPPGLYFWDNVAITEVPEAEAAAIRAEREKQNAAEKKEPRPTPRKHKAGDSFVIEQEEPMELPVK